jgi:hypothetical protein
MTQNDFIKLWQVLQMTPELMRPWPTCKIAGEINLEIDRNKEGHRGNQRTIAHMSHSKALSAVGNRSKAVTQKTVIGVSATTVGTLCIFPLRF